MEVAKPPGQTGSLSEDSGQPRHRRSIDASGVWPQYHPAMRPIVIALTGGVGNQLFQFAAALALSESTGREIRICVRGYDRPVARRLFLRLRGWWRELGADDGRRHALAALVRRPELPDLTELPVDDPAEDRSLGLDRRSLKRALRGAMIEGVETLHEADEVRAVVEGDRIVDADRPILVAGFMQTDAFAGPRIGSIRSSLRLPTTTPHASRWIDEVRNGPSVSIHVRRGDYTKKAFDKVFVLLPASWYHDAASVVSRLEPGARWFVFSDDHAWCRTNLHLPGETQFVESSPPAMPTEDLAIMTACRHHVVANSTFSWWGARLATEEGEVVAPTRWNLDATIETCSTPPRWTLLENPACR